MIGFLRKLLRRPTEVLIPPLGANSPANVAFRERLLATQEWMIKARASVTNATIDEDFPVSHYFSPLDQDYGCGMYGRELFIEKGAILIGRIHRHHCLNILAKGKVIVTTEAGQERFEAPYIFVSGPGTKRAIRAEEDSIWINVTLAKNRGVENLAKVENEMFADTYQELGLVSSLQELTKRRIGWPE